MTNIKILFILATYSMIQMNAQADTWFEKNLKHDGLYKIMLPDHYHPAQENNCMEPSELDIKSGFIHASFGHQVGNTIEKFFKEAPFIFIAELNINALIEAGITIKIEQNKPGGAAYPHLYNAWKIPYCAVCKVFDYKNKATLPGND